MGVDVVNLGTGESHSVYDLVNGLGAVIGEPLTIEVDPERTRATDRPFLAADPAKMRCEYQWSPRLSLMDSLQDLWRDHDIPSELLDRC